MIVSIILHLRIEQRYSYIYVKSIEGNIDDQLPSLCPRRTIFQEERSSTKVLFV